MGEIELGREGLSDGLMMRELLAVVRRQRMDPVRQRSQLLQDGLAYRPGRLVGNLRRQGQPGLPLHQRDQRARVVVSSGHGHQPLLELLVEVRQTLEGPVGLSTKLEN